MPGLGGSGRKHEYKHAQGIQQARRDKPDLFCARGCLFHSAMKVLRGAGFVEVLALVMIDAPHTSQDLKMIPEFNMASTPSFCAGDSRLTAQRVRECEPNPA